MPSTPRVSAEPAAGVNVADPRARGWLLRNLDRVAIAISGVCLIQCLATPLLLTLLPVLGGTVLHGEFFHRLLVFVILPTSGVAFLIGCRRHRRWRVLLPATIGLVLIVTAAVLGYGRLGVVGETAMTVMGSLFLAWAHLRNFRLCREPELCPEHASSR